MSNIKKHKDKRESGKFVTIGRYFLQSHVRKNLSMKANTLLMDLLAQYKGFNNGDLCLAWKIMKEYNWRSRQTLVDEARNTLGVSLSSSHLPLLFKLKYLGLYST